MKKNRRNFTGEFKMRVVMESIRGEKTLSEIASEFEVHPNQIRQWKEKALASLPGLLNDRRSTDADPEHEKAKLYEEIGRLKVERDWLQKNWGSNRGREAGAH